MDYDQTDIPAAYDRGRDHGPEVLELSMTVIASHLDGRRIEAILDLGCGSGRFSESLANRFDAHVVGIDPSEKMLAIARQKRRVSRVQYGRGTAEAIPLVNAAVDMIFMSMSFHHFRDAERAARECHRVLRAGGTAVVRNGTREQIPSYPYLPFFPQTRSMMEELLPNRARVHEVFEVAGFGFMTATIVRQAIAPTWAAYADKLAAGVDSVLARLSTAELAAGHAAVREFARGAEPQPVIEPIDMFFFRKPDHG